MCFLSNGVVGESKDVGRKFFIVVKEPGLISANFLEFNAWHIVIDLQNSNADVGHLLSNLSLVLSNKLELNFVFILVNLWFYLLLISQVLTKSMLDGIRVISREELGLHLEGFDVLLHGLLWRH